MGDDRPRLGISACLLGRKVRFDGGHKRDVFVTDMLGPWFTWVPVCPEVELGLGTPRESLRLVGPPTAPRLVAPRSGSDITEAMSRLAEARAGELAAQDLAGFILKKDSPSCGMERVRVHGRGGMPVRTGVGLFARALMARMPLLPVEEEGRLHDPLLRENFIERVFAYGRWRRFGAGRPSRGGLVRFHTAHKLTLLAHDPTGYRRLGALVARAAGRPLRDVLSDYAAEFMRALGVLATRPRHANVLEHVLGHLSSGLDAGGRREMVELIADYRRGLVPLVVPLTLVKHHARRLDVRYLLGQVYLDPHPRELMLRNHV
jgi:uncharacterized protein YbgA (DUF1722 family)/uncharacterized protein YbbK (DUF523 family)